MKDSRSDYQKIRDKNLWFRGFFYGMIAGAGLIWAIGIAMILWLKFKL